MNKIIIRILKDIRNLLLGISGIFGIGCLGAYGISYMRFGNFDAVFFQTPMDIIRIFVVGVGCVCGLILLVAGIATYIERLKRVK
jgi:hypothetical protein